MVSFAEIIVDVPAKQTDKPFVYQIPTRFENMIKVGMRVSVPFGNGNRLIQGFVIGLKMGNDFSGKIKEIKSLIDVEPVLTEEAIALAKWMAHETYSFLISCLQVMLPSAMRAKYYKQLVLVDDEVDSAVRGYFSSNRKQILNEDKIDSGLLKKLLAARVSGKIELEYLMKDNLVEKKVQVILNRLTAEGYKKEKNKLRANALKLQRLLDYLIQLGEVEVEQTVLEQKLGITSTVIKNAETKKWLKRKAVVKRRVAYKQSEFVRTRPRKLTVAQKKVTAKICNSMSQGNERTFLLEGVTGSGKTEVYLQAMAQALENGKTALMLVPEIALTPQMVKNVVGRFGSRVALLHSGLSEGERLDEWHRIQNGDAQVVVGARSAVFAPLKEIGIIVIDEEHEASYKQEKMPRYHAIEVAKWRARYHKCSLVLGSATPSLESRARAQKGVYEWLHLNERINKMPLPEVKLIDMRIATKRITDNVDFSSELCGEIALRLERKEQIILMLNRRGYSSFMMCRDCGEVLQCPNCDISLTLHLDSHSMKCHYCGHEEKIPQKCPNCGSNKIRYYGTGTQKVEQELQNLFPEARVLRMDVDTTRRKGMHAKLLKQFGDKKADILLGTQMIAKGLDYPDVTLVGVLNADTALGLADFRASERTFQLLTQVSGRAGRADKEGKVIIQTFNPEHYALQLAKKQDYESFFFREMNVRHQNGYPPYFYTIQITAGAKEEGLAAKKIYQIYAELKSFLSTKSIILGPTPKAIMRINNQFYYQLIIKYKQEPKLDAALDEILQKSQKDERQGVLISIDKEPLNFI
ncbi:primosomal protein N' [Lactobacillus sp. UCMA15818]|uniref:primosomal protein N' n=1 Tax=Lactobacillus sp. UCMA15818 TaxID=2583394 RepID=UPI0025B121DE|nr:primosomal protein N' [Lactobacillus sp. UCMA15818]MDN2452586.1 primosomal protein N' [Lactobacillus sp. UCMA15818]